MSWNPYGTTGPAHEPGVTWRNYFDRYLASQAEQRETEDVDTTPIVLYSATGVDLTRLHPLVSKLYQSAMKVAQSSSCGCSAAFVSGSLHKSGENKGQYRPDKIIRQWWFYAVINGKLLRVTYAADDAWLSYGTAKCVNRQYGWDVLSNNELKELLA